MRILFAGTPLFAAAHLQALLASGEHELLAVYTQPDRPSGRGKRPAPSPVKQLAEKSGIPVEQPASLKDPLAQQRLAGYGADLMVVVAYGLLLPRAVLETPKMGCINVHASLLPRWRGAAPVERAIEAGDAESGVTIMQMDEGLDTGPMLLQKRFLLSPTETGDSLRARLCETGGPALLEALRQLQSGTAQRQQQDDARACYAHKLEKHESRLDFGQPAPRLAQKIRAFTSALPCYGIYREERIKLYSPGVDPDNTRGAPGEIIAVNKKCLSIACGQGALHIPQMQLPGGKIMGMAALLNGRADFFAVGECFAPCEHNGQ